jgi:hypothetical protein
VHIPLLALLNISDELTIHYNSAPNVLRTCIQHYFRANSMGICFRNPKLPRSDACGNDQHDLYFHLRMMRKFVFQVFDCARSLPHAFNLPNNLHYLHLKLHEGNEGAVKT